MQKQDQKTAVVRRRDAIVRPRWLNQKSSRNDITMNQDGCLCHSEAHMLQLPFAPQKISIDTTLHSNTATKVTFAHL